jgi:hypothetical protein
MPWLFILALAATLAPKGSTKQKLKRTAATLLIVLAIEFCAEIEKLVLSAHYAAIHHTTAPKP